MDRLAKKRMFRFSKVLFGLVVLLFVIIVLVDFHKVRIALATANWKFVLIATVLAIISCLSTVSGYVYINKFLGLKIPGEKLFKIGFITITLNNLLTMGGAVGYGVRVALMREKDVSTSQIIFASLYYSILNFFCVSVFLAVSLFYLLFSNHLPNNFELAIKIILCILPIFYLIFLFAIFNNNFRVKLFRVINKLFLVFRKKDLSVFFYQTNLMIIDGFEATRKSVLNLIIPIITLSFEWIFCVFSLWFCFLAFHIHFPFDLMVSGFFLGLAAGFISMIPGGLGVQELSSSAIFNTLGINFSEAILITILFRAVYYILPLFIGLIMYAKVISENQE
jgi:uncharacterized protein (TIRG00374 family)